jgi:hypothetical protein
MSGPVLWGSYIAGHASNTSTRLHDTTGNNRHATIGGTITTGTASGNGATASIPYINGTKSTTITWPILPTTFTICSITRATASNQRRILASKEVANNLLHGHWDGYSGISHYGAWKTQNASNASSVTNYTNWLVMCGTNGSNAFLNNMLANGTPVGIANGGTGSLTLTINNLDYPEQSHFGFNQVIIWNGALSNAELATESLRMMNYLNPSPNPWGTSFPIPWGSYVAGHAYNTSTFLYDITGNGRNATISGTITTGNTRGNGATASIPYINGTTSTKITWPSGSIPSTFTICSITRVTASNQGRVLASTTANSPNINLGHGHHGSKSGWAFYGKDTTLNSSSASSVSNYTDWLVMCGTNGSNATPNNILANGLGIGTSNSGAGGGVLTINDRSDAGYTEQSNFGFNQVIIWDVALTNEQLATVSSTMISYLTQVQFSLLPPAWGSYIAGHTNNTSTTLYDTTGNGRNATISGTTAITTGTASGNGATASIPYINGAKDTIITWPSGSIPSTFTICSITRVTASGQGRVLNTSSSFDFVHGHHDLKSGVAYYRSWKTQSSGNAPSVSNYTNWLVMCGTNGSNATPNNILANGSPVGTANGGAGVGTLTINTSETSNFSFNQVIIWDVALTNAQLATVSSTMMRYLNPVQTHVYLPRAWGSYIAGHANNTSTTLYDTTGNGRHATISGTITTGTASGNGAVASIPYISGPTSTTITWPTGSIPTTFTICSITRVTESNQGRVLNSTSSNFIHGHHNYYNQKSGVAHYSKWMTLEASPASVLNYTDWLVMCGTNGSNATPNNILANGAPVGTANGGTGGGTDGGTLTINTGVYSEPSNFSFNQVIIWNVALTNEQLATISSKMMNYLNQVQSHVYLPRIWGSYIADYPDYNSLYDLSLVRVGTQSNNIITQTTSTISGVSVYALNQPTTSLTDYYYYVNNSFEISGLNQNFTVSYWYYNDTANTQYTGLFWAISNADYSKNITCSKYYINTNTRVTAISIGTNFYIGTNSISTSGWVHEVVICSYNPTTNSTSIMFYRNNVLDTFNTSTYSNGTSDITYSSGKININGRTLFTGSTDLSFYFLGGPSSARMAFYATNNGSTGFNGLITQVNVFDTAISSNGVSYLYNNVINTTPSPGISTTGLVMYYPFDIDTLNYATGSGVNDVSINDSVTISTNHTVNNFGSLYFPGGTNSQQRFQLQAKTLTPGGGMTFSIWAKFIRFPASNTSPNFRLFDFGNGAYRSDTYSIVLYYQNSGITNYNQILVYIKGTNENYLQPAPNYNGTYITLNDQIWHHYCLTIDGNGSTNFNVKLYIDRVNVLNRSLSTTANYPSTTFNTCLIGQSNNTGDHTSNQPEFYVNNFMLFNRVITELEINTLYTTVASTKLASIMKFNYWGLIAYYPFNNDILNYANGSGVNDGSNDGSLIDNASRYTGEKSLFLNSSDNSEKGFKMRDINLKNSGITISFWLKLDSFPDYNSFPSTIGNRLFYLGETVRNCILAFITMSRTAPTSNSTFGPWVEKEGTNTIARNALANPFTLDTNWHHYCFTISPTSYHLTTYVDGLIWGIITTQTNTGTPAVSSSTYPFNVDLTNCYIGTSISAFGTGSERFNPMYVNDFMVFNRCINYGEIGTLMSFRNTVLNGNFTGFNDGNYTSLSNVNPTVSSTTHSVGSQYSNSVYNTLSSNVNSRVSGWSFSGTGTHSVVIYAGNGYFDSTRSVFITTNPQQYSLVVQYSTNSGSFTAYQQIYLTTGSYILSYRAAGRLVTFNSTTMTLTASLLQYPSENSIFSYPTPSGTNNLTNDGIFRKYSQSFTITTTGLYTLNFNFNQSAINDSIIGLTGVEIDKLTQSFKTNETDIGVQFQDLVLQTGLQGLTILPDPNAGLIQTTPFYNSMVIDTQLQNKTLYMFGTRNASGFRINGVDLGTYYQQDSVFDSNSGYCFALNMLVVPNQFNSNISRKAQAIWPQNNNTNPLASNANIFYWVYYTFYYNGANNTGSVTYGCDNLATLYFNGTYISVTPNNGYIQSSINIVSGLNYIRIACYNSDVNTVAFLIATFRDSGSNVVAVTNPNWAWSLVPSTYANTTDYKNILGALPFIA